MSSLTEPAAAWVTSGLAAAGQRPDLDLLGGKGANLARLAAGGFPVPDGFVITTEAYRRHVSGLLLSSADPADVRSRIESAPIDPALATQIRDAYRRLGDGPVAVRSSATAEDLPGAAFAGQQDTYLDVAEPELLAAVARCWASLWTDRAIAYRQRIGIPPEEVTIAVVVQRMVPAEIAGVMFTADPVTGRRDRIMIDATAGLGEALVSGEVTPDHYLLDGDGQRVEFRPGGSTAGRPLLDDDRLRRLAELGAAVRDHFGGPQDIEWAIADGAVHLLQARPMTALPSPVPPTRRQRLAASVATDYFAQRPYPLDVTTWVKHGPAGMMLRLINRAGIGVDLDAMLPETEDGVVIRLEPPRPRPTARLLLLPVATLLRLARFDPARWRSDPRVPQFHRRLAALSGDPTELSWRDLVRRPRDLFRVSELAESLREDFLPSMAATMLRLRFRLALIRETALLDPLIAGAETETTRMNDRLAELADRIRQQPGPARLFRELTTDELLRRLRDDPELAEIAAEFDQLLADFGHRETVSPVLVSTPTWADQPEAPLGTLQALVAGGDGPARERRGAAAETTVFGRRSMAEPGRRAAMRRAIDAARAGMAFREDSHDLITRPAPVLRRCLLEIGRRLQSAGVLAEAFDVFHLRLEEIEQLNEPDRLPPAERDRIARLVRRRMIAREQLAATPMIDQRPTAEADDAGDALAVGTPAGSGVAVGPARVITSPAEFGSMRPREVLVCPYTNPAWTPLFQRAAAVVADTGGVGSHAAIVAREYGLPAVMGTGDGTRRLRTGQLIKVDGSTGRVTAAGDRSPAS